ncbi:isoleucine--tRNA ligase [Candidatus Amesbacteria bacterium RIFOXYB1_FULL_44_23]|uniref:Isoleucine--tRNA ligase n=1 Tax=Candidatus Amesbacteria bacterium RIFOXYB1_FULL_44_23 TaxID=1797263 RepID=A0A1F4ZUJ1_9BACT|nr:MAG: isoleucine--tRNA ligase [Candidatus Amesbacteria bacterium RIFOXYB1_FULL_44_23]
MAFKQVSSQVDFPQLEKDILNHWYKSGIVNKYLTKNLNSPKKFSFLDGPITANNPMGVHHAWGRTYKDLWLRFHTMKGEACRYQNGFDCQGLWVEVEVEKELGFRSKKDIETYGVANFVNKCKERVIKYSTIQTEQSKRLGYFMDWDNSYFTMSDENNYAIWGFLKECWQRKWIYKGHDVVPWCPRCETAISQHEILTEDYKDITHDSVFVEFPIVGRQNEYLLIWTTTPWTLIANTAVALDADLEYSLVEGNTGCLFWVASALVESVFKSGYKKIIKTVKGKQLAGLKYLTPFDSIDNIKSALDSFPESFHVTVLTDPQIMPISQLEGTGLVHTSTSTGEEDHKLGKKLGLPVIPAIDDQANYLPGFGRFSGQNAKKHPEIIIDFLKTKDLNGEDFLFSVLPYRHRYPACWRCKTELVWKVTDEWYIAMDRPDPTDKSHRSFRKQMIAITKKIHWLPGFGLDRELDWLNNMHDWLISKKNRYWGLALPIYECSNCGHFEVVGDKGELQKKSVSGFDEFKDHSPHKPWIDQVKISCPQCQTVVSRIPDVGNPWLDAGIVSISTLPEGWFPADFITESFPGQFKNWFYSVIAMGTVLKKSPPFKTVLGFASLLAEDGRPMHKSWGNAIEFNEGADKIGVDVMRWMYVTQNPEDNLLFGYKKSDETRRQFHLMIWNIYNFFVTYANLSNFVPKIAKITSSKNILDTWILLLLNQLVKDVTISLDKFDAYTTGHLIESFVGDLSLWYVRRSRDRVNPSALDSSDKKACLETLYTVLVTLSQIMAPLTPFLSEEIYTNLTSKESVHLSGWPKPVKPPAGFTALPDQMKQVRKIVELGLSKRKDSQIKVRQPLRSIIVSMPADDLNDQLRKLILDEINVKEFIYKKASDLSIELDTQLDAQLIQEGELRELIRQVQELRKQQNISLDQKINLEAPFPADSQLIPELKRKTLAVKFGYSQQISVSVAEDE